MKNIDLNSQRDQHTFIRKWIGFFGTVVSMFGAGLALRTIACDVSEGTPYLAISLTFLGFSGLFVETLIFFDKANPENPTARWVPAIFFIIFVAVFIFVLLAFLGKSCGLGF